MEEVNTRRNCKHEPVTAPFSGQYSGPVAHAARTLSADSQAADVRAAGVPRAIAYRVGQFLRGFTAHIQDGERRLVAELLPPAAQPLFARMPADAQRHSLDVLYTVQAAGFHDADLGVAALLHDTGKVWVDAATGKTAVLGLWWRGPLVVLEHFAPRRLARWADAEGGPGVRHLLYLHIYHPQVGAAAARAAGCSELTCRLIEQHQEKSLARCGTARESAQDGQSGHSQSQHSQSGHGQSGRAARRFRELLGILQWADSRN